jgi:hypothetical protein
LSNHKWVKIQTFVFVTLGFDAEYGYHHDDDDDGRCSQSYQEPGLPIKGLRLEISKFQKTLGRSLNLQREENPALYFTAF